MSIENGCVLWQGARTLAGDEGHELSVNCPMQAVCSGEKCVFADPIENLKKETKKTSQHPDQVQPARV